MLNAEQTTTSPAGLPPGDADRFRRVAVVGAGLMGRRLAGTFSAAGVDVALTDARPDVLPEAEFEAQALAAERGSSTGTVSAASCLAEALEGVDLVTEAVVEDVELKRRLFAEMAQHNPTAVLASNSSALPIATIAADLTDASLAVGTHWWNPPDLIPIVEVVQGEQTDPQVVADVIALMHKLGKVPVWVRRDTPGFIGNRIQHALWREAVALVAEGVADAETVDLVVRNTIGLRLAQMGPLENADYVGLDLARAIHEVVFPVLDRSTTPNPMLLDLIEAGHLGAKSGRGFLPWPPGSRDAAGAALAAHVRNEIAGRSGGSNKE